MDGVDLWIEGKDDIMFQLNRSVGALQPAVCNGRDLLHLVMGEEEATDGPLIEARFPVIDFDLRLRHDAKVVASTTNRPEQFGIGVLVHGDGCAIGEDHTRGNELVRCEPITTLVPAMSATEDRGDVADTGTDGAHGLLVVGPQEISHAAVKDAALNQSTAATIGDGNAIHATHQDADRMLNIVEIGRRAMRARNGMEGFVVGIGVFDLLGRQFQHMILTEADSQQPLAHRLRSQP